MKLCTVVGARPQFIKAATVSRLIVDNPDIEEVIIHTGQHYDNNMSQQFFEEMHIPTPNYNLNIGSASHGKQTGLMLAEIENIYLEEKPDCILVYGDTNSTLAGALAAAKLNIPVAHVEAGLRSFNRNMPEEINRITTDHISTLLFPPTELAYQNLIKEGFSPEAIHQVGDVMYDATLFYKSFTKSRQNSITERGLKLKEYSLVTIHRAENTNDSRRLTNICNALIELSREIDLVLPLHPRTAQILNKLNRLEELKKHIRIVEPMGYLDMLTFEHYSTCIITDSGGVQKEAFFNEVPCITLRDETEWVELVESGWNHLCSPQNPFSLLPLFNQFEKKTLNTNQHHFYGTGDAAVKILNAIEIFFKLETA